MYGQDMLSTPDAITEAQRIAFAPIFFQAASCLCDVGILDYLDQQSKQGAPLNAVTGHTALNGYTVGMSLDMGLSGRITTCEEGIYYLAEIGHYFLYDIMAHADMDLTQDVCYQGFFFLADSFSEGKSSGLGVFGDRPTIYSALSQLPGVVRDSWFAFDHYYSDGAFSVALLYTFASNPITSYDVGGSTGKWVLHCCEFNRNIAVALLDLPRQTILVKENIADIGSSDRIDFHMVDMLSDAPLPGEADIQQVSQLLDCFSPEQIISILSKVASVMKPDAKLCIMGLFWDAQRSETTSFDLNTSSLHFTCMANGNSRFYSAEKFYDYLNRTGFQIAERHDNLGVGHTFLIC